MNRDTLSRALGDVADRHIASAAVPARRQRSPLRRIAVIAVAAALCLMLALPALASSETAYPILYALSPGVAQFFKPVNVSCEDRDVRMEVVSAYFHGDTAEIYVTLRDLLGDRIDGTTDLYDSYAIHQPFDSVGACRLESYDPDTHTATFYLRIQTMDGSDIPGGKVTFSVGEFLSHRVDEDVPLPQTLLTEAETAPETLTAATRYVSEGESLFGVLRGGGGMAFPFDAAEYTCLAPRGDLLYPVMNHVAVTAAGYIGGKLHIQAHLSLIHDTDTHGYVYLKDADGEELLSDYTISFWDESGLGTYEDHVFLLSPEELAAYTPWGHYWSSAIHMQGNWSVTFPLEAED